VAGGLIPLPPYHILYPQAERLWRRKIFYPPFWAWEQDEPFSLAQVKVKDILDKGTLRNELRDHRRQRRLPRYQWIFCKGKSQLLRFLAYRCNLTNGLGFMALILLWLRRYGLADRLGAGVWRFQSGPAGVAPGGLL